MYNPTTFNQDKYKKTGWTVGLIEAGFDNGKQRLIVRVATGRKFWPLFSEVIDVSLGIKDTALFRIKGSLKFYTFPMLDRFVNELDIMLTDVYDVEISLNKLTE